VSSSDLDYLDLKHLESVSTEDGYQLEKYENPKQEDYSLLLREQRFGPILSEVALARERDADQILEAASDTAIREVLEQ